jgi:hypothetical protein
MNRSYLASNFASKQLGGNPSVLRNSGLGTKGVRLQRRYICHSLWISFRTPPALSGPSRDLQAFHETKIAQSWQLVGTAIRRLLFAYVVDSSGVMA